MTKRLGTIIGALGLAAGLGFGAPQMASAQEVANNTAFGDWVVNCEAVTTTQNVCRLVQVLSTTQDDALVVRFVGIAGPDDTAILLAQVPMGVYLPGGAVFGTEGSTEDEQMEMIWQRCLGRICEAAIALSAEDIAKFTDAGSMLFGYRMQVEADPIVVRVDVSRFGEALAAIAPPAEDAPASE